MKNHSKLFIKDGEQNSENTDRGIKRKILSYNEDLMLVKVAFEAGAIGKANQHIYTQTICLLSGKSEVIINGKTDILNTSASFYAPPVSMHGVVCLEAGVLPDAFNPYREDF